jgi:nuclear transport factor 2 (NTF2) superfamily protein
MEPRTRLSAHQRTLGVRRQSDRGRFAYESHDDSGNWYRSYGNENWEFDEHDLKRKRYACINDLPITEAERKYHCELGSPRPPDHPGRSSLGP